MSVWSARQVAPMPVFSSYALSDASHTTRPKGPKHKHTEFTVRDKQGKSSGQTRQWYQGTNPHPCNYQQTPTWPEASPSVELTTHRQTPPREMNSRHTAARYEEHGLHHGHMPKKILRKARGQSLTSATMHAWHQLPKPHFGNCQHYIAWNL